MKGEESWITYYVKVSIWSRCLQEKNYEHDEDPARVSTVFIFCPSLDFLFKAEGWQKWLCALGPYTIIGTSRSLGEVEDLHPCNMQQDYDSKSYSRRRWRRKSLWFVQFLTYRHCLAVASSLGWNMIWSLLFPEKFSFFLLLLFLWKNSYLTIVHVLWI